MKLFNFSAFLLILFISMMFLNVTKASVEYNYITTKVREPLKKSTHNSQLTKREKRKVRRAENRSRKYKLKQRRKKYQKHGLSNNNTTLGWVFSAIGVVFALPAILIFAFQLGSVSYFGVIFIGIAILAIIIAVIFLILGIAHFTME